VAVALVCERLVDGRVTAIDRSATMIKAARTRNRAHVDAGRARFEATSLAEADFGEERFDKILAINVSAFLSEPEASFAVVRRHLEPAGRFLLSFQAPTARRTTELADTLGRHLSTQGFERVRVVLDDVGSAPAVCAIGERLR
jgi:SAM-dependent methyltransferase